MNSVITEPGTANVQHTAKVCEEAVHSTPVPVLEEIAVPVTVQEVYNQVLQEIADDKDVIQTLRTIWCKVSSN